MPAVRAIQFPRGDLRAGTRRRTSRQKGVFFAFGIVWFLVLGLGGTRPEIYLTAYIVLFAFGVHATWGALHAPRASESSVCVAAIAALLLLPIVQILLRTTVAPAKTETAFLHIAAGACAFWLAFRSEPDEHAWAALLRTMAVVLGVYCLFAVAQSFLTPNSILGASIPVNAGPMGTFINRDDFAGFIELLLPLVMMLLVQSRHDVRALIGWSAVVALAAASVVLGGSRAGSVLVGLELLWLAWAWRAAGRSKSRSRSRGWVVPTVVGVFLAAATGSVGFQRLQARFHTTTVDAAARRNLALSSFAVFRDRPLAGTGLGTWKSVYPPFARFHDEYIYDHAHDDYAEWLAESGVAGVVLFTLLVLVLARQFWRNYHNAGLRRQFESGGPRLALAVGIVALLAHATVDFVFHIPSLMLCFSATLGLLLSPAPVAPESRLVLPV
jgi:O-antigen ligase